MSILIKNEDQSLNALGGACASSGGASEQAPAPATPAASHPTVAQNTSIPAVVQTPSPSAAPAVTPTASYAVKPLSTAAGAEATPQPSAEAGDEDGDKHEEEGGDDEEEGGDDEDEGGDEEDEDEQPQWWQRHHKQE
jgi:hypothetical protein